jgi:hypothetical protein
MFFFFSSASASASSPSSSAVVADIDVHTIQLEQIFSDGADTIFATIEIVNDMSEIEVKGILTNLLRKSLLDRWPHYYSYLQRLSVGTLKVLLVRFDEVMKMGNVGHIENSFKKAFPCEADEKILANSTFLVALLVGATKVTIRPVEAEPLLRKSSASASSSFTSLAGIQRSPETLHPATDPPLVEGTSALTTNDSYTALRDLDASSSSNGLDDLATDNSSFPPESFHPFPDSALDGKLSPHNFTLCAVLSYKDCTYN